MVQYLGGVTTKNKPFAYRASYDAENNVIYEAWAATGSAEDSEVWQIVKHFWTGGNLVKTSWANSSGEFAFKWSKKTTYTYL